MDVVEYVGKYVKIDLVNGFYYEGIVKSIDEDSLFVIDKFGKSVSIRIKNIDVIKEIDKNVTRNK